MILLFLGYLSVLLPEPSLRNEIFIENGKITLPYGVSPFFEDTNKIDVSVYSVADTVNYVQFCPTFKYRSDKWGGVVAPYGRWGGDYFYPRKEKFGIYSDFVRGSMFYKNDNILFSLGKDIFSVGPAFENNPLLSPNIPLNYLNFNYRSSGFSFTHLISRLGNYEGFEYAWDDTATGNLTNVNRYIGMHRLEFKLCNWLAFSVSEMMLIGGESLGFPFELLVPFTIYFVEQHNRSQNTNIFWNFDLIATQKNFLFYFDFFMDDFQYEEDPWKEPNHIGLYSGLQTKNFPWNNSEFFVSYNLITRWAYDNILVWQRYTDNEIPLGSILGCDYDRFILKYLRTIGNFKIGGMSSYTRRGENRIFTPWPVNSRAAASPENEFTGTNFLYGTIEKRLTLAAIFKYKAFLELTTGLSYFTNYENQEDTNKILPAIELKLKYGI